MATPSRLWEYSEVTDEAGYDSPQNGAGEQRQSESVSERPGSGSFCRRLFGRRGIIGGGLVGGVHGRRILGLFAIRVSIAAFKAT